MELVVGEVYKSAIKVLYNGELNQDEWVAFLVLGYREHHYTLKILDSQCKSYKEGDVVTLVRLGLIIVTAKPFTEEDRIAKSDIRYTPDLIDLFIDMALQTKDQSWFNQMMALKKYQQNGGIQNEKPKS